MDEYIAEGRLSGSYFEILKKNENFCLVDYKTKVERYKIASKIPVAQVGRFSNKKVAMKEFNRVSRGLK